MKLIVWARKEFRPQILFPSMRGNFGGKKAWKKKVYPSWLESARKMWRHKSKTQSETQTGWILWAVWELPGMGTVRWLQGETQGRVCSPLGSPSLSKVLIPKSCPNCTKSSRKPQRETGKAARAERSRALTAPPAHRSPSGMFPEHHGILDNPAGLHWL